MGVGTRDRSNFIYINGVIKKDELKKTEDGKPYFLCKDSKGEEIGRHNFIDGYFHSIKLDAYEYEGKMISQFKITLSDGDEMFQFQSNYNIASKSLLNSFLSLEQPGKLDISIYLNKDGYPSYWLTNNGEPVRWKFEIEDIPPVVRTELSNGDVHIDDQEQVAFYEKAVAQWLENYTPQLIPEAQRKALDGNQNREPSLEDQAEMHQALQGNPTEAPDIGDEQNGAKKVSMEEHMSLRDAAIADGAQPTEEEPTEVMDDLPF